MLGTGIKRANLAPIESSNIYNVLIGFFYVNFASGRDFATNLNTPFL